MLVVREQAKPAFQWVAFRTLRAGVTLTVTLAGPLVCRPGPDIWAGRETLRATAVANFDKSINLRRSSQILP